MTEWINRNNRRIVSSDFIAESTINADYGGLKGYEVFILYSSFNNFKKINMNKKMKKKGGEKCESLDRLFTPDLTNSVRGRLLVRVKHHNFDLKLLR